MKTAVSLFLFVFISFLAAPTIISLIKNNTDVSIFYSINEEEIQKDCKELKADLNLHSYVFFEFNIVKNKIIISKNHIKHDSLAEEIFSPPPELI